MGVYTHYLNSYGLFYDQPIVLNDRQAPAAVHGVEAHNAGRRGGDQVQLSLLAVDTHGYTNAAMAVAKLLGLTYACACATSPNACCICRQPQRLQKRSSGLKPAARATARSSRAGTNCCGSSHRSAQVG